MKWSRARKYLEKFFPQATICRRKIQWTDHFVLWFGMNGVDRGKSKVKSEELIMWFELYFYEKFECEIFKACRRKISKISKVSSLWKKITKNQKSLSKTAFSSPPSFTKKSSNSILQFLFNTHSKAHSNWGNVTRNVICSRRCQLNIKARF